MATAIEHLPIQLALFDNVDNAKDAIEQLKAAGFTAQEISVLVAKPEDGEQFDAELMDQQPAGSTTNDYLDIVGLSALGFGAIAIAVGVLSTAGTAIYLIGAATGLTAAGTFLATMLSRGAERELADYYDQAVVHGQILVGVETDEIARRERAAEILANSKAIRTDAIPSESVSQADAD